MRNMVQSGRLLSKIRYSRNRTAGLQTCATGSVMRSLIFIKRLVINLVTHRRRRNGRMELGSLLVPQPMTNLTRTLPLGLSEGSEQRRTNAYSEGGRKVFQRVRRALRMKIVPAEKTRVIKFSKSPVLSWLIFNSQTNTFHHLSLFPRWTCTPLINSPSR